MNLTATRLAEVKECGTLRLSRSSCVGAGVVASATGTTGFVSSPLLFGGVDRGNFDHGRSLYRALVKHDILRTRDESVGIARVLVAGENRILPASPSHTRGRSRMLESGSSGSVRGAPSNGRPLYVASVRQMIISARLRGKR